MRFNMQSHHHKATDYLLRSHCADLICARILQQLMGARAHMQGQRAARANYLVLVALMRQIDGGRPFAVWNAATSTHRTPLTDLRRLNALYFMSIAAVILANKDPSMNLRFLHTPMGYQRVILCMNPCFMGVL
jgi:hypothetical protein